MEKRELSSYLSVLRRLWRRLLTAPALLAYLLLLVLVTVTTAGESLLSGDGFITPSEPLPYLLFKYLFFPFLTFLIALYYYRCHHRPEEGKEDIPVYNPRWEGLLILFLYFLWLVFVATKLLTNRYLLLQFFAEVLVVKLLPAVIIFKVLFRYRWRDLGVGWHWGWTVTGFLALLVAGALLWRREPAPGYGFLLGNFFIQLGTVAFPEEFLPGPYAAPAGAFLCRTPPRPGGRHPSLWPCPFSPSPLPGLHCAPGSGHQPLLSGQCRPIFRGSLLQDPQPGSPGTAPCPL